jgi:hypothetical protein
LPPLLKPCLYFIQIPHDASRREIEPAGKFAPFFHLEDRAVGERHDEPKLVPSDGARQAGENRGGTGVPDRIPVIVVLIWHHQDAHAGGLPANRCPARSGTPPERSIRFLLS